MNVTILNDDPDIGRTLLRRAWVAARTCYSSKTPTELWEESRGLTDEKMLKVVEGQVIESGHLSVLRHLTLTYGVEGISRTCAQQLTRHVAGFAFDMQSQRYVTTDIPVTDFVVPKTIEKNVEAQMIFDRRNAGAMGAYSRLRELGIPDEDARSILPNATPTNLVVTINFNALINLCHERLCVLAQEEIRLLVARLRTETIKVAGFMKPHLVIKCQASGVCTESRNKNNKVCNIRPHVSQIEVPKEKWSL